MKMSVIKSVAVYNEYTPIKEINNVKEKKNHNSPVLLSTTVGGHASSYLV